MLAYPGPSLETLPVAVDVQARFGHDLDVRLAADGGEASRTLRGAC